jgi:hypothetical protein
MMRIKYQKTHIDGEYKTEGFLKSYKKGLICGIFNVNTLTYKVTSHLGSEVIAEGTATSRHKLLKKLKEIYISLGCPDLEEEERVERLK